MIDTKVAELMAKMTLEEKVGQMVQYSGAEEVTGVVARGFDYKVERIKKGLVGSMLNVTSMAKIRELQQLAVEESRLGIPMIFAYDVIHGYKTMFPIPLGETASWDMEVLEASARVAAKETAASGIQWTFAPMMDTIRDARWGRVMEGAGEDVFLNVQAAVARIKGFQGDDLSAIDTVAACAKHFAGYGFAEAGREYNTTEIGEATLHNQVLPPFKAAVKANVATFMNGFNDLNGIPVTANRYLQRGLLKGEWQFDGMVVSDWGSVVELQNHGVAKDETQAAELALTAGCDMDMEGFCYEVGLVSLVKAGKISEALIDDACRRILKLKFQLGLFDNPYKYFDEAREQAVVLSKENIAIARDIARKSIVLLKNEGDILPIKATVKTIAVIGPFAADKNSPLGSWRAQAVPDSAVSLLEGIQNAVGDRVEVLYAQGVRASSGVREFIYKLEVNKTDFSGIEEAVEIAKKADIVLLAIGEDCFESGEGRSKTDINLAAPQQALFDAIQAANPNTVVILSNGRPMSITNIAENATAILETWHLGSASGDAIADVLFGKYNPSGKLPMSFPRHVGQCPIYYNRKSTGRPWNRGDVFWSHYIDEVNEPLFPFGYGLSYTTFELHNLHLAKAKVKKGEEVQVSVDITNTGNLDGHEVVQLYIWDLVASVARPIKELKAFQKVFIKAGEMKRVTFSLSDEALGFYNQHGEFMVEVGAFKVFVGSNSVDLLTADFELI